MDDLSKLVDDLYCFRDRFFESHPISEADQKPALLNTKLEGVLEEFDKVDESMKNNAECLMLRGKALNVTSEYNETAQKLLSKAVKLDPELTEAWICLGECYWKNDDIKSAQNCFLASLNHKKDKVSLRNLSMITRSLGSDIDEKCKNIESSFEMAKEAVQMDLNDGLSWLTLGNAYLSKYFVGKQDSNIIKQSLSAYSKAENDPTSCNNFDLHFNKGTVHEYLENYEQALNSYSRARHLDPTFEDALEKETRLFQYLIRLSHLISTKGKIKNKKLKSLVEKIDHKADLIAHSINHPSPNEFCIKTLRELCVGANQGVLFSGKVVGIMAVQDPICLTFCMVDKTECCCAITLYNASLNWGIKIGDSLMILEPYLKHNDFSYNEEKFDFFGIRVESPLHTLVSGKVPRSNALAPTVLTQLMKKE